MRKCDLCEKEMKFSMFPGKDGGLWTLPSHLRNEEMNEVCLDCKHDLDAMCNRVEDVIAVYRHSLLYRIIKKWRQINRKLIRKEEGEPK